MKSDEKVIREFPYSEFFVAVIAHLSVVILSVIGDAIVPDHIPEGVESLFLDIPDNIPRWAVLFSRWDAVHFINIARFGYQHEYQYAFFPMYPMILSLFSKWGLDAMVTIGLLANTVFHYLSFLALKRIVHHVYPTVNPKHLIRLHYLSPATIFFVSLYSESLFAFLSWTGLSLILVDRNALGGVLLAMASLTRSNGIFNVCPILIHAVLILFLYQSHELSKKNLWADLMLLFSAACCSVIPNLCWHYYITVQICSPYVAGFTANDEICNGGSAMAFLFTYSNLQRKYWNVGFLRQYQWRQLPNFVLAFPTLYFALTGSWTIIYASIQSLRSRTLTKLQIRNLPWLGHLLVNVLICMLLAHLQISTRLLFASCPFMYCIMLLKDPANSRVLINWKWIFVSAYFILGAILHTNHFPWT